MNSSTLKVLIVVIGLAIVGALGYFGHHLFTGQMSM
jgi:preprotein translocase subunit Sss1